MNKTQKSRYFYGMLAGFGAISLSVAFFFVLYHFPTIKAQAGRIFSILASFVYGGVIAYLLRPMCNFYEGLLLQVLPGKARRAANAAAVALSVATGLLIVYVLLIMIIPELGKSIQNIWLALPGNVEDAIEWLETKLGDNDQIVTYLESVYTTLNTQMTQMENWVSDKLLPQLSGVLSIVSGVGQGVIKVAQFIFDLVIGLIVAIYLLSSRRKFSRQGFMLIRSALKPKWAELVIEEIRFTDRMFGEFITGKLLDSAIMGVLCYIGCSVLKFPNALLVSVIVGITNVIPFFGPLIGAIPSALLILLESPIQSLWFLLFIFALQQLDGNIIGPKILGARTGLSSFWVLFSIVLFGGLWGLVGMIIAVPLMAVIYDIVKKLVHLGLEKNGCARVWDEYNRDYGDAAAPPETPADHPADQAEQTDETK